MEGHSPSRAITTETKDLRAPSSIAENSMDLKKHWDSIYGQKREEDLSWTQAEPSMSLKLIREASPCGRVIDVGGGRSLLCERLLDDGYSVTVLDISPSAIKISRTRLGSHAGMINWVIADLLTHLPLGQFDVWHDRALFHFLASAEDRRKYVDVLTQTVPAGGHAVIATFALDGPTKCSGLEVQRYDASKLSKELGSPFVLLKSRLEEHMTPWGTRQSFQFCLFKRA